MLGWPNVGEAYSTLLMMREVVGNIVTATMSDLSHTPSTLISIGRCMRSQLSTHSVMRGGGTIRSIASDVEAATCGDAGRAIAFVAA